MLCKFSQSLNKFEYLLSEIVVNGRTRLLGNLSFICAAHWAKLVFSLICLAHELVGYLIKQYQQKQYNQSTCHDKLCWGITTTISQPLLRCPSFIQEKICTYRCVAYGMHNWIHLIYLLPVYTHTPVQFVHSTDTYKYFQWHINLCGNARDTNVALCSKNVCTYTNVDVSHCQHL